MATLKNSEMVKMVLVVADVERRVDAFCSLFPMERPKVVATDPAPLEDRSATYTTFRGRRITGRVKMANLKMGPVTVELIEPVDSDSPWAEHLRRHGEGIFSIVFTVENFEGEARELHAAGVERYHVGEYGSGRYAYFGTEDLLGVVLGLQSLGSAR